MKHQLEIKRLTIGTTFKLVAFGLLFSIVPFSILMGLLSLFGLSTVTWNDEHVTGISGLLVSPLIGVFVALFFTLCLGIFMSFGLWLFSTKQNMKLHYISKDN
ncbi:MAG: hypothetical protein RID53_29855 [Coleofasciculus sp. B1-GNL1-01]|uniref:hypothetical protein n=1 Tax=Coleofasciculus sp. B1-GNL1-01 TaxID=3068484 RepID=UPI0032FA443D